MKSYYKIAIKGKDTYTILNNILQSKINIYDAVLEKNTIILVLNYEDFLKLKKQNPLYKIEIISINGIKRYKSLFKFYKLFIIMMAISQLLIYFYSKMIFKINITSPSSNITNIIKEELKKNDITLFSVAKPFSKLKQLKDTIKNNNKDKIEWLEIEHYGTNYNINVIERKKEDVKSNDKIYDLVALKNGIIKDMYIESGEIIKNKGDYVAKGDVIVSSKITKGDTIKNNVRAKGKIYAEVWYKTKINGSLIKQIPKIKSSQKRLCLRVFNQEIEIFKIPSKNNLLKQDKTLFSNNILKLYTSYKYEINYEKEVIDEYTLTNTLEELSRKEILKNLKEKEKILLQKTLKKEVIDDKIYLEVFFKVYENIALEKEPSPDLENED